MKTIAFNRSRGSMFSVLMLTCGLVGLYLYRRRGGEIGTLFSRIMNSINQGHVDAGVGGESVSSRRSQGHVRAKSSGYQMDSVNLDTTPAI